MPIHHERRVDWACDYKGCNRSGTGKYLPEDWRKIQLLFPGNKVDNPGVQAQALLCPEHATEGTKDINWNYKFPKGE